MNEEADKRRNRGGLADPLRRELWLADPNAGAPEPAKANSRRR